MPRFGLQAFKPERTLGVRTLEEPFWEPGETASTPSWIGTSPGARTASQSADADSNGIVLEAGVRQLAFAMINS